MRLAILADIHGNLPALRAVLEDVRQQEAERVVVAGDFSDGPGAPEVIRLLRSLDGWMIRGNREDYFLAYHTGQAPETWRAGKQWAGFRWMYRRLDEETLDLIASLPEQRVLTVDGTDPIRVVHGAPQGASTLLVPLGNAAALERYRQANLLAIYDAQVPLDEAWAGVGEPVLICAHSHIPWVQEQDHRIALNPGSVGAPINGDPRAQYGLLTWQEGRWRADLRAVAYDVAQARAAYHDSGVLEAGGAMVRAFLCCVETGQNVPGRFILHVRQSAAAAGYAKMGDAPDALWDEAAATFDWEEAAKERNAGLSDHATKEG
jgi:predicted phosphodiesterase